MRRVLVTIMAGMLGLLSLATLVCGQENPVARSEAVGESAFGVSVATDKANYASGEPIAITLKVFNRTGEKVTFHFSDAQRYDFVIEDQKGKEVWRWSDGKMFAQMLGEERLGPGREQVTYTAKYEGRLRPGGYKLEGILTSSNRPMSATVSIVIQ